MKWDRAIMAPIIPQLIGCHIHAGQGFCRGKCLKVTLEKVGNLGGCREIDKHAVIKFCQSIHHKIQCTALCILEELKREKYWKIKSNYYTVSIREVPLESTVCNQELEAVTSNI